MHVTPTRVLPAALAVTAALAVLAGCGGGAPSDSGTAARPAAATAATSPGGGAPSPTATPTPAATPTSGPSAGPTAPSGSAPGTAAPSAPTSTPASVPPPGPVGTTARTEPATLDIPSIGLAGLKVVPYQGTTDDRPGTRIQDGGVAASPYGEQGGVGPGEVGNYLVTAHRLSAGGPLRDLPSVREGDLVVVTLGGTRYEYVITGTRSTSFRSPQSLAEQRAPVPGQPGSTAVQPMITVSTCATPEDNAAGNRWRDANGNPEHRIDKIGVLRAARPAG